MKPVPINAALPLPSDKREMPLYTLVDAAGFVGIPLSTLKSWVVGRKYVTKDGQARRTEPIIHPAAGEALRLSFFNLVEAHILKATRTLGVRPDRIRAALDYVAEQFPANREHPLITQEFYTEGKNLFIRNVAEVVNASAGGQAVFAEMVERYLGLIEREVSTGLPLKLFPERGKRIVVMNPSVSSGRPVLRGTGVMASMLADREAAGESVAELAAIYRVPEDEIRVAITYATAA